MVNLRAGSSIVGLASLVLLLFTAGCPDPERRPTSGDGGSGGDSTGAGGESSSSSASGSSGSGSSGSSSGGPIGDAEPAEMNGITALHNAARASVDPPAATPIPPLAWSADVAAEAQAYAEQCVWMHSGNPKYGENLFASSGGSTPADVVGSWVSEEADYDYASNGCSGICGHYTQVVWAKSMKLGCGKATCTSGSPFGSGNWEIWVCNYDPPGNFNGEKPY